MGDNMQIEIKDQDILKALQNIVEITGCSLEETIEFMLIGCLAKKAAWGDTFNTSEPGMEFNKHPDGSKMEGQELYESVYLQVKAWLNTLILGERLLINLVNLCREAKLITLIQEDDLKKATQVYINKIERSEQAIVN